MGGDIAKRPNGRRRTGGWREDPADNDTGRTCAAPRLRQSLAALGCGYGLNEKRAKRKTGCGYGLNAEKARANRLYP